MANRIEITENVENATGINIAAGATVVVKLRGGAATSVFDREDGGALITQPLAVVDGKIGADNPAGAWVPAGTKYDLEVTFGGNTLVFPWTSPTYIPLVTTLPAGVGTAAPEDGEFAEELYDAANGAAWLRRWRSAASAWDMIGGPPPAGGSLPGSPRTKQEFYVTGGTPPIRHMRYNGSTWEEVGPLSTVPVTGSPLSILEVGQSGQHRAGRILTLADFSTLLALPTTPILLANLTTLTSNLGTGGALVNKGTVTNGSGIDGAATAAQFTGSTAQVLYSDDTGAADPFRIKVGSWGCWFKTAKRSTAQFLMVKGGVLGTNADTAYTLVVGSGNVMQGATSDGTNATNVIGVTDVCDDRWHHAVITADGTVTRLYVDGVLEATVSSPWLIQGLAKPFNIGAEGGNAGTAPILPHFGRVDEAFVTADVLSDDQVRLIYATSFPHGYSTTPTRAELSVRRKRRGAALVSGDFPSQPVRLHSLVAGALTDAGTGGVALTANGSPVTVPGPDGTKDDAYNFISASSQSLSATDTGLPTTTASRSYGIWFKTANTATQALIAWGNTATNYDAIWTGSGFINGRTGAGVDILGSYVTDGQWHLAVVVIDNAATDAKLKVYVDGRLVGSGNPTVNNALAGANAFRIGCFPNATSFFSGQLSRAFVHASALTAEQVSTLYEKSSQALASSIKEPGSHIEAMDATNIYFIGDTLDDNYTVDLAVAA